MKKGIMLVLVVVITGCVLWAGCGGGGGDESDEVTPAAGFPSGDVTGNGKVSSPEPATPAQTPATSQTPGETVAPSPIPSPPATETPVLSPTPEPTATESPQPGPTAIESPSPSPSEVVSPVPTSTNGEVFFPDANLEAAIRNAISKSSGDIHQADLAGLTTLNAGNKGISNLTGLESCTSLSSLDLSYNEIADIAPLVANAGLGSGDVVHLEYNPLSSESYDYVKQLTDRGVEVVWGSL